MPGFSAKQNSDTLYPVGRDGERRQVTAVFYDIVNSTALLASSDPEDFRRTQRLIHDQAITSFKGNGGYIASTHGDGGSVYFGIPVSFEDAAACAVSAALDFIKGCRDASEKNKLPSIRVGVATGTVVLSDNRNSELAFGKEIVGLAPNLATRLQNEAEPNTVAVSDVTYQLTRTAFHYSFIGERQLKGFDGRQAVWCAVGAMSADTRFLQRRTTIAPLISREHELGILQDCLRRANARQGKTVFISGEPGIGKSRLIEELSQTADNYNFEIRRLQCQSRATNRPLHPLIEHLRPNINPFEKSQRLDEDGYKRSLRNYVKGLTQDAAALLAPLMIIDLNEDIPAPTSVSRAQKTRTALVQAAVNVIQNLSGNRNQLIIVEDMHWSDTVTADFFIQLAKQLSASPVLLVGTSRDPLPEDGLASRDAIRLALGRLSAPASAKIVREIWRGDKLTPQLINFIIDKSDGIPLFIEELTKLLREKVQSSSTSSSDWDRILAIDGATSLKDLLSARLAALGDARQFAQVASTLGRVFSLSNVSTLLSSKMDVDQLANAAGKLLRAGLIETVGAAHDRKFRFRHALVQETAHESLLKGELQELHNRIVELTFDRAIPEIDSDLLAWHCEQCGRYLHAAQFALTAAENCAARSAIQEADRLLNKASKSLDLCQPGDSSVELTLRLLAARGVIYSVLHGVGSPLTREVYERGISICRTSEARTREKLFPLYWGYWFTAPDFQTQRQRSKLVVADLAGATDPEIRLQALHCSWATSFNTGQHHECLLQIEQGLKLYNAERARDSRIRYGHDAKVCALGERALSAWLVGNPELATKSMCESTQWAKEIDHLGSTCHALDIAVTLEYYRRNVEGVFSIVSKMSELAEKHLLPGMKAKALIFGGWAKANIGSLDQGFADVEDGLAMQKQTGTSEDFPVYYELRADLLGRMNLCEDGIKSLDEVIERASEAGHLFWLPELYRRRALLRHGYQNCLDDLHAAEAEATRQGAISLLNRATYEIERLSNRGWKGCA
jgi:predicted ATPase/class 3 adenylate cyclase